MQFANNKMELDHARVLMTIMVTHMKVVGQNVFIVQIVLQIKPVLEINVLIRAPEFVALMLFVQLLVMYLLVTAYQVTLEILSHTANLNRQVKYYTFIVTWPIIKLNYKTFYY